MEDWIKKPVDLAFGAIEYFFSETGFARLAGLAGGTAVIMAAYGAHAFQQGDDEETMKAKAIFESGNKMHIMHALALMGVPLTNRPRLYSLLVWNGTSKSQVRLQQFAAPVSSSFGLEPCYMYLVGSLMIAGMLIFSGTCYYTAITGNKNVAKFTPYGGMLLIISWFLMLL